MAVWKKRLENRNQNIRHSFLLTCAVASNTHTPKQDWTAPPFYIHVTLRPSPDYLSPSFSKEAATSKALSPSQIYVQSTEDDILEMQAQSLFVYTVFKQCVV